MQSTLYSMKNTQENCAVCGRDSKKVGWQKGLGGRQFQLNQCLSCGFAFVSQPRTDFHNIYNENYYLGKGADPTINHVFEFYNPKTSIRQLEFSGLLKIYKELCPNKGSWLDFGCGVGGLVRYCLEKKIDIVGCDDGWGANLARSQKLPVLSIDELIKSGKKFEFITAIEVLEHCHNPIEVMQSIHQLLKPGGILFLTTGNIEPWQSNLLNFEYTKIPDVHISFFTPNSLRIVLEKAGFNPVNYYLSEGMVEVLKFKILKGLGFINVPPLMNHLPWNFIARVVNRRYKTSLMPYGISK